MRVLVACEFSGTVRDAFAAAGHDATSCDLLPTEKPGAHIVGDVRDVDLRDYDLLIAHPPCTYLAASGARWWPQRTKEQASALEFVRWLMDAPVERIAIENPVSIISSKIRKPDQIVHPWMFGHPYTNATCLWLKGLPALEQTHVVSPWKGSYAWEGEVHRGPRSERWRLRSRTFPGLAHAMALQWAAS